jgi:pyruvate/2-oxoglutarate dehydrogenase complex dihydrolipoamide dehydrogenase (E3) component
VSHILSDFDVEEQSASTLNDKCPNVEVILAKLVSLDADNHVVTASNGQVFKYSQLCLCTGGSPKLLEEGNSFVLGIRDTDSVKEFQEKLKTARRVVLVGNGGIATELAYEISNCNVVWVIKDKFISRTFVDAGAAEFFLPLLNSKDSDKPEPGPVKRMKYTLTEYTDFESKNESNREPTVMVATRGDVTSVGPTADTANRDTTHFASEGALGGALGPDWSSELKMVGSIRECFRHVTVEFECEVFRILRHQDLKLSKTKESYQLEKQDHTAIQEWPVYVELTTGKIIGCDFVVSATGAIPNTSDLSKFADFELCEEQGLCVNHQMQTNVKDIYAAGDICTPCWKWAPQWFQVI